MGIEVIEFRRYERNTLKGFLTVRLEPSGLEIRDLTVHKKGGRRWIGMPSRAYTDDEGETQYSRIVHFPDKERAEQFRKVTIKALDRYVEKNG